jgi:tellurite resistance-related uncharacterized protein
MNAKELRALLDWIGDDAQVLISAQNEFGAWAQGNVIHIAVTSIDNKDKVLTLCNCVSDADGNTVFNAPTQFHRVAALTDSDKTLREQLEEGFSKPTATVAKEGPALDELLDVLMAHWRITK